MAAKYFEFGIYAFSLVTILLIIATFVRVKAPKMTYGLCVLTEWGILISLVLHLRLLGVTRKDGLCIGILLCTCVLHRNLVGT